MKIEKKNNIITAAQSLFARFGLKKTTVDEIAKFARVGKGTIYKFFRSKEEVFSEVVDREIEFLKLKILEAIDKETQPEQKIRAFMLAKINYLKVLANLYHITQKDASEHWPEIEEARQKMTEQDRNIIKRILDEGVKLGVFVIKNTALTAMAIAVAFKGFEIPWMLSGKKYEVEKNVNLLLGILFNGIKAR